MYTAIFLLYLAQLTVHLTVISILGASFMFLIWMLDFIMNCVDEGSDKLAKFVNKKAYKITMIVLILIAVFMPTKNLMYTIAGIYTGTKLIENPQMNNILDKSYKILDQKLDEILNEKEYRNDKSW